MYKLDDSKHLLCGLHLTVTPALLFPSHFVPEEAKVNTGKVVSESKEGEPNSDNPAPKPVALITKLRFLKKCTVTLECVLLMDFFKK